MSLEHFSAIATSFARAFGNHLWQSTLFAATAALLTVFLRPTHARFRYSLWLAASAKFLIPFSLFLSFGAYLNPFRVVVPPPANIYLGLAQMSQPFSLPSSPAIAHAASSAVPLNPMYA